MILFFHIIGQCVVEFKEEPSRALPLSFILRKVEVHSRVARDKDSASSRGYFTFFNLGKHFLKYVKRKKKYAYLRVTAKRWSMSQIESEDVHDTTMGGIAFGNILRPLFGSNYP